MWSAHGEHGHHQELPFPEQNAGRSLCAWCADVEQGWKTCRRADVLAVDEDRPSERHMKLMKKLAQPRDFSNNIGHNPILSLTTGPGDCVLVLGGPGDEVVTKEDRIARSGLANVRTACPISIRIDDQHVLCGGTKYQEQIEGPANVAKNPLESTQVWFPWIVHVETNLLDDIGNVWTSEGQILKRTSQTTKVSGILNWLTNISRDLWVGVNRSRAGFAFSHTSPVQSLHHVRLLRQEHATISVLNFHPKKVMQLAKVLHTEFML